MKKKKRILIGGFVHESNAHVSHYSELEDFVLKSGEDVIDALYISDLDIEGEIEFIPTLYADGRGGGVVRKEAFDYIYQRILRDVELNKNNIDAIFMFIHGASHVQGLGSGDHRLIKGIREIVGEHMPIAIVSDPHGNMTDDFVGRTTIHRTFRHSPHTDRPETHQQVFKLLLEFLDNRRYIKPEFVKIPIMLGGERSVSTDEPMVSINKYLDEIENDPKIMCASLFIGYVRHDSDKCGAAAVVVPQSQKYQTYAAECAKKIHDYMISKAEEFKFHGLALELEDAMKEALAQEKGPIYITDSGDNCTAGASGFDTYVLRKFLELDDYKGKNILFACIADPIQAEEYLQSLTIGDTVDFELGMNINEFSKPIRIKGILKSVGKAHHHYADPDSCGETYLIKIDGKPISVIVSSRAISFAERNQYEKANVDMDKYDFVIVKQGYLYPELKAKAEYYVMALTDGATQQRTERLDYKMIRRPMYPYDPVEALLE